MKEGAKNTIMFASAIVVTLAFNVAAVLVYNKRQRTAEFNTLIKVIDADKGSSAQQAGVGGAFDRNAYKTNASKVTVTPEQAARYAEALYKAKGTDYLSNDDEDAVSSTLRQLQNVYDVSRVADAFYGKYRIDLLTYLESFLSKKEMQKYVYDITEKLR